MKPTSIVLAALSLTLTTCSKATPAGDTKAIEAAAHGSYVAAINSNDLDTWLASLTDDVVYQAPHEPEIVGKAAVRKWGAAYLAATTTKWDKTPIGFKVSGDWAFERYRYTATDTNKKTGLVSADTGKGINIFHREADGKWRVAVDSWSSDLPVPIKLVE